MLMKKAVSILLILVITTSLVSCAKDDSNGSVNSDALPLFEVIAETQIGEVLNFAQSGDNIVLVGRPRSNLNKNIIYIFDKTGKLLDETEVEGLIHAADVDNRGYIWLFYNKRFLDCYNIGGDLENSIELSISNAQTVSLMSCNRLIAGDNQFLLTSNNSYEPESPLFVFDLDGNLLSELEFYNNGTILDVYRLSDNRAVLKTFTQYDSSYSFAEFNTSGNSPVKWDLSTDNISNKSFNTGFGDYLLLSFTDYGIDGYNLETGESVPLIDWFYYDVDNAVSGYAVAFDDDFIFSLMNNPGNGNIELIKLTVTDMDSAPPQHLKKTLTAAGFMIMGEMQKQVEMFNKESPDYRIVLKDYVGDFTAGGSFSAGLQQFNMDVMAGNIPDIILMNDIFPIPRDSFANKGMFTDLYELMDNDPDIDKGDYLPNILKALEIDGKLYFGASSFYVKTLVGKTSVVGPDTGWTWDNFYELIDEQPPGTIPFAEAGATFERGSFLRVLLNAKINDYIDTKTGTCDFMNTDFVEMLQFVNSIEESSFIESSYYDFNAGNPLLMCVNMMDFFDLREWENTYFKDDITFIGFPSDDGQRTGAYATLYNTFALSASSENLDGAWEFAKYLLVDCQKKIGMETVTLPDGSFDFGFHNFPIKTSELYRLAEDSRYKSETRVYSNSDTPETVINRQEYNTDKEIDKILDLILSITDLSKNEQYSYDIIFEEADWFFAGQRTAQQVAEIIQSRISLYLAERS